MNIHEYQAKQILKRYHINIPNGGIAYTPAEAKRVAQRVSPHGPWMLKAQIQSGARADGRFIEKKAGKEGGIRLLKGRRDIFIEADKMLGSTLKTSQTGNKGKLVSKIYVEEYLPMSRLFYASLVIDRMVPCVTLLIAASTTNIVELAGKSSEKILRINLNLDDRIGFREVDSIMAFLNLPDNCRKNLKAFINGMHQAFIDLDAMMIEINPVGVDEAGVLTALDAKITFDDNALYRHEDIMQMHDDYEEEDRVLKASKYGFQYQDFDDGNVGCIVNGDGVALTINDILHQKGEQLACFLNVKGGVDRDRISAGIKIILTNPRVEGILINILGGFLRCNLVADGIIAAAAECGLNVPLVVRFEGTDKEEAERILVNSGLPVILAQTTEGAVSILLAAMKESD